MKNVIILASGGVRYAVELRWVREIVSLGHVTRVPRAPAHIAGVVSVGGAIVPVLDLNAFRHAGDGWPAMPRTDRDSVPQRGEGAVLIDVEGTCAAIHMDAVEEVVTVIETAATASPDGVLGAAVRAMRQGVRDEGHDAAPHGGDGDHAVARRSRGRDVPLLDPPRLIHVACAAAREVALSIGVRSRAGDGLEDAPPAGDEVPHAVP